MHEAIETGAGIAPEAVERFSSRFSRQKEGLTCLGGYAMV
jgi:hypothetical protein